MAQNVSPSEPSVPDKTLETLARNFCRQARDYGFSQIDYLRYVNHLLEYAHQEETRLTTERKGLESEENSSVRSGEGSLKAGRVLGGPDELPQLPLKGKRVDVRLFQHQKDETCFHRWLTDDYGRYFLLSRISGRRSDVDAFLSNPEHLIGVVTLPDGEPIGCVAYLHHDEVRKKAELRKLIGEPTYRGCGLAREATEMWLRFGLRTLGLRKIYVNTLNTHFRNIKLNESLGFQVEGLLHHEALIDGTYHDVLRMGLWADGGSGVG